MSFSSEVKHEITTMPVEVCCMRAQISSFLHINSSLVIRNRQLMIEAEIENATIARQMYKLIKDLYDVDIELTIFKKQNLNKNNIYVLTVQSGAEKILNDIGIYEDGRITHRPAPHIVEKECCVRSYLAGAFLASGSINAPTSRHYHLEISTLRKELAQYMVQLLQQFDMDAKIIQRRLRYVVYIKAADKIADFLKVVGAYNKTMEFEDIRIQRDFKNSLTRLDNCEVANEVKTIKAGSKQLDAIYKLIEANQYNNLDEKIIMVGDLRMNHPESSLNELIDEYEMSYGETISKSGLQHRFKKIMTLAAKLEED
ncbi:DNA-binding protein WhiA [Erysipelothrix urinaevulpis]|uniref:DNA-binding protein WhiA n=1 Tax=Erysipelothrix urinaevulpis TaxID=2683717 RepID=UPI00135A2230|nr:DNA-binding protein WhiA [Erysipelothrix urinaevulpis]